MKALHVLIVAVAVATLVPAAIALSGAAVPPIIANIGNNYGEQQRQQSELGFYTSAGSGGSSSSSSSRIEDAIGDAEPVQQFMTNIVPEVKGYHDITGASIKKLGDSSFLFTIELAGNPNTNEKYETIYRWHIITTSAATGKEQIYTIMIPNFAPDSGFPVEGWNFAIFDVTSRSYIVPLTRISDMPNDRVEFPVETSFIGNPSQFHYWVSVGVRVNSTFLNKPPDYLMDYAP